MSATDEFKITQIIDNGQMIQLTLVENVSTEPISQKQMIIENVSKRLDAETKEQVTKRVVEALKELVKKNQGKRIIVVTHGGCLNKISRWVKNNFAQQAPRHIDPENASISLISVTNDKWKIENWAQTNHLKKDEQSNENTTKQISPVSSTSI